MRGPVVLLIAMLSSGCVTTTVSRTLMIPLQPTDPAGVAPNPGMFGSAYGTLSAMPLPINLSSSQAQQTDTGDQVAGVQADLGGMFHVAEHVLIGGDLFGSPSSAAVKAAPSEIPLGTQLLFGFRTRVGFVGELPNGLGLIAVWAWGFDFLPYADTLSGTTTQLGIASTLSGAVTWHNGILRLYLGPSIASQPTLTKIATTCSGCGTSVDYDLQVDIAAGVKVQLAPTAAVHVALMMPLVRDRIAWTPVITAGFAFDLKRPHPEDDAPEEPPSTPPPPPRPPYVPPPPPML